MRDEINRAMQVQSAERMKLEEALAAAHKTVMEKRGLPADSGDPGELFQLTLDTIPYIDTVAHQYAKVAFQAGALAQASLEVARAAAEGMPLTEDQQDEFKRAEATVANLRGGRPAG